MNQAARHALHCSSAVHALKMPKLPMASVSANQGLFWTLPTKMPAFHATVTASNALRRISVQLASRTRSSSKAAASAWMDSTHLLRMVSCKNARNATALARNVQDRIQLTALIAIK